MITQGNVSNVFGYHHDITFQIVNISTIHVIVTLSMVSKSIHQIATLEILPQLADNYQRIFVCANKYKIIIKPSFIIFKMMTIPELILLLCNFDVKPNVFEIGQIDLTNELKKKSLAQKCVLEDLIVKNCFDMAANNANQKFREMRNFMPRKESLQFMTLPNEYEKEMIEFNENENVFGFFENSIIKVISQQMLLKCQLIEEGRIYDINAKRFIGFAMNSLTRMFSSKCNHQALIKIAQFIYKEIYVPTIYQYWGPDINPTPISDEKNRSLIEFEKINKIITTNKLNDCDLYTFQNLFKDLIKYQIAKNPTHLPSLTT